MKDLRSTVSDLAAMRGRMGDLLAAASGGHACRLTELHDFGRNPGKLRMWRYVPAELEVADGAGPALVVALHGCTQTAASYDDGSGWSVLAERHGFALLMPEQQAGNNPNLCFNWFEPAHTRRGGGEAFSIHQMVRCMIANHGIDPSRVFIVGLSAGGGMTSAMLAAYPETFSGGAVIAGLPAGAASNLRDALEAMRQGGQVQSKELGDAVRRGSPHEGPWPRVSVWHGDSDAMVAPANAENTLRQWIDVHGLSTDPVVFESPSGHRRRVWRDDAGRDVLEAYTVAGMAHGVPIGQGDEADRCGRAGPLHFDVGISSSARIARFWGIESAHPRAAAQVTTADAPSTVGTGRASERETAASGVPKGPSAAFDPAAVIQAALHQAGLTSADGSTSGPLDPRGIVNKALAAVKLLKGGK